jgi:hypothetical protein
LSEQIICKLNSKVSAQTLRRYFGLIKTQSEAGSFTLNLLSKFCGFRDFKDFVSAYSSHELEIFFSESDEFSKDFWRKGEDLCKQIQASPEMLVSTHHRLMLFPLVRKYFMELHPMRDLLGTVYTQYFLSYLKFNQSNEAKIFAYGFLFHAAFLQQNTELMDLYHSKVRETRVVDGMHVIPTGLKYGVQLLYADFINDHKLFRKTFLETKGVRLNCISGSRKSVCSFEYSVLEMLIFTDRKKEIQFLLENNTVQTEDDKIYVPLDRKHTHDEAWRILCAIGYQKIGEFEKSKSYIDRIDVEKLGVGWKNYFSILFYFTKSSMCNIDEKLNCINDLEKLLEKSYFPYFDEKLSEVTKSMDGHLVL